MKTWKLESLIGNFKIGHSYLHLSHFETHETNYSLSMQLFTLIVVIILEKNWWLRNNILFEGYNLFVHSIIGDITND